MTRDTRILRSLLVLLLVGLVVGCGLLYALSLESARSWPELAHLRLPVYLAVLVGLLPVVLGIRSMFDFVEAVDSGAAFSDRAVEILRRLRALIGAFAGYAAFAFLAFWIAIGLMHPTLVFLWFAVEVAALFLFTTVALLERVFAVALELRQDSELTV